ncbi:uncharacterized protein BKCO1_1000450 [Diplodia corticola]|uniref:Fungal N-terminal domain-containing protein n=1 Tax=Diplodia corticola TaxID=236234 RepID=A0A1J9SK37_9PEZI|nr:uncharacterized protein BKCO1_1000450 [Diplodia corticola]OJD40711.1 hypothetical protein BKCO1_1000450 [Diplodia corticola]
MVEPASAILAIVHVALTTSKELAEAIGTMKNSNAEVTRVHSSLTIHTTLLRQFHSTINKANSMGAQMAQQDDVGSNMARENELIIGEMNGLVKELSLADSEGTVNSWDRLLFRWRWYLYKSKMTALRQELDSIRTSMTLFVCMVELEEKMRDPAEQLTEPCRILEEQIHALRGLLKLQDKEIQKTRQRLDYGQQKTTPTLNVGKQIWDLSNEQHRRWGQVRRQRRMERLRPSSAQRRDSSESSSPPQAAPSPGPSPLPPPGHDLAVPRVASETVSPRSSPSTETPPLASEVIRTLGIRQVPKSPPPRDLDAVSSTGTVDDDGLEGTTVPQSSRIRKHMRPREAGFQQEQVNHEYGPGDAPRTREFFRDVGRGEGSPKH